MTIENFLRERRVATSARRILGRQFPRLAVAFAVAAFAAPLVMAR